MKKLITSLFAIALYAGATAQSMTEVTSYEDTFISALSSEEQQARKIARFGGNGRVVIIQNEAYVAGNEQLDIYPEIRYAGEPFDVYFSTWADTEATFDLYDRREKRPKKLTTKGATHIMQGNKIVRIVIDEPGTYEIKAYEKEEIMNANDPERLKSRWTFEVLPRRKQ